LLIGVVENIYGNGLTTQACANANDGAKEADIFHTDRDGVFTDLRGFVALAGCRQ
jgi:hypothetical protein